MNLHLTIKQKRFLDEARKDSEPYHFFVSESLTTKRLTIRIEKYTGYRTGYVLTIDNRIDPDSKLEQVNHFYKTGDDIGCTQTSDIFNRKSPQKQAQPEPSDDWEIPF